MIELDDVARSFRVMGHRAKDRITGVEGVITTVTFDLYGCIQVLLHPGLDKDGKSREQVWLDVNRLEPIAADAQRVMTMPTQFAGFVDSIDHIAYEKGPADKPPTGRF